MRRSSQYRSYQMAAAYEAISETQMAMKRESVPLCWKAWCPLGENFLGDACTPSLKWQLERDKVSGA